MPSKVAPKQKKKLTAVQEYERSLDFIESIVPTAASTIRLTVASLLKEATPGQREMLEHLLKTADVLEDSIVEALRTPKMALAKRRRTQGGS